MKYVGIAIGSIILILILAFGLEMLGLQWTKFFKPKYQNVEREVFEETKSYVHGKIQDLAKYYAEYEKSESEESKTVIQNIIKSQFAEFDETNIRNLKLRSFLKQMRGY